MAPRIADIQRAVCEHFGIARKELLSEVRVRRIAYPRQICCYLAREMTPRSYAEIGRRMGRDHSTVIYAERSIRKRWFLRGETYRHVNRIRARILEPAGLSTKQLPANDDADPIKKRISEA